MSQINIVHTPCKSCVFAEYDNKTQKGCRLGYIDRFKENGIEVLEAYDSDLEFYIVNKKKCLGYRENAWFTQYGLEHADIESKIAKFKELNRLEYLLVINFVQIGCEPSDMELLEAALSSLTIKPQKIVFIRGPEGSHTTIYASIQALMKRCGIECKWRIQTMVDDTISNEDILHNTINLNKNYRFICDIRKANCVDALDRVILKANDIVYNDLGQFIVLTDKSLFCMVFGGGVYRYSLVEKGLDILSDENNFTQI